MQSRIEIEILWLFDDFTSTKLTQYPSSSSPKRPPMSTSSSSSFFSSSTAAAAFPPAAAGPADGAFLAAANTFYAYGNSNPLMHETATRFLKPFKSEWGAEAWDGTPTPRESFACTLIAFENFSKISASVMSRTPGAKIYPPLAPVSMSTFATLILYSNGYILSLSRS